MMTNGVPFSLLEDFLNEFPNILYSIPSYYPNYDNTYPYEFYNKMILYGLFVNYINTIN